MIASFYAYIKTIIGFLIFTTFVEVILPSGKWKKYSNILLGLLMLGTLLNPLQALFQADAIELPVLEGTTEPAMTTEADDTMVMALYQSGMAEELKARMKLPGYEIQNVAVEAESDGSILGVQITVRAEGGESPGFIEPVAAFGSATAAPDLTADAKAALERDCGLSVDKITVTIQKS